MSGQNLSVCIIGGGISGLATGFALQEKGINTVVYESTPHPGGVIRSIRMGDWLVESGPNTVLDRKGLISSLARKTGLEPELVSPSGEAGKRFVIKNGSPVALPASPSQLISTPLLSARAKLRLLKEPFIPAGTSPESIHGFFERRLGREVVDYAVNPFVSGVYAGDPDQLSMEHTFTSAYRLEQEYGSLLKGAAISAWKKKGKASAGGMVSFRKGLQQLPESLSRELGSSVKFSSMVTGVIRTDGEWQIEINGKNSTTHKAVVCTAPLHRLPSIHFEIEQAPLLKKLSRMRYAPVATVALGFKKSQIRHSLDGFGILVPEVEDGTLLGCLFSSSLFKNRAPDNHVLLTCFAGGERNPEWADLPQQEIKRRIMQDLELFLGCTGNPVFEQIHKWKQAIPQYGMNHQSCLDMMTKLEQNNRGFYLTGNFREEISVAGCIGKAYETAERLASFLQP